MEVVAVGAVLQLGSVQQLGRLGTQVVGHVVFDGQQGELVVAACMADEGIGHAAAGAGAIQRVVDQAELLAGLDMARAALAFEALEVQLQRAQGQLGGALGMQRVFVAVGAGAVIDLQRGQLADAERSGHLGRRASQVLVVPRAQGHRIGLQRTPGGEGGDRILLAFKLGGRVLHREADLANVFAAEAAVRDHQRVQCAGGRGQVAAGVVVLEVITQTFLGQQARDKFEITFAVLHAQAALAQLFGHLEAVVGMRVVGKDVFEDGPHILVLVDEAVAPQRQKAQPGPHHQPVAGQATVGTQLRRLEHIAMPGLVAAIRQ